jgi:hypothetical protein
MDDGLVSALNFLHDGLALVSRNGEIMFSTDSARQFLACEEGSKKLSRYSPVRRTLESLGDDASLPHRFSIHVSGEGDMPAYADACVFALPLENVLLLVLRNQTEAMLYARLFHNLMEMLSSNLRLPVDALEALVRRAEESGHDSGDLDLVREAAAKARSVSDESENLIELANIMGHHPFAGEDRIPAADLFVSVVSRLKALTAGSGLALREAGSQAWLPVIYGSVKWLSRAIEEHLVVFLGEAGEVRALLAQVTPSESGFVMSFKVEAASLPGAGSEHGGDRQADSQTLTASHLSIFRHVLKLHGIRVRMNRDRDSGLPELLFEFQEQQSNKIEPGIGSEQAQRYAQDFVRLYHVLKKEQQHEITN